jgi:hypothetical protein
MRKRFDIFISHASEDKLLVARPLYRLLRLMGYSIWFDEFELRLGDSLLRKIDEGLSLCRYGVVIISPSFLSKRWPKRELDGLVSREDIDEKVILPVWHDVEYNDVLKFSPILAGRLAVKSSMGLDKVAKSIASAIKTPKRRQYNDLPNEVVTQIYIDACEGEELFIEFCRDVVEKGDFLKNVSRSLREGVVDYNKSRRIIENLSYLFLQRHLRYLFELVCLDYDEIQVSDEVIRRMVNRGLSENEVIEASHFMPRRASTYLCRLVFNAFYNQGISPLRFEGALFSPAFLQYCLHLDIERTLEIIDGWKERFEADYLISDAVAAILYMIEHDSTKRAKNELTRLLRRWRKSGILDWFMESEDSHAFEVRQLVY